MEHITEDLCANSQKEISLRVAKYTPMKDIDKLLSKIDAYRQEHHIKSDLAFAQAVNDLLPVPCLPLTGQAWQNYKKDMPNAVYNILVLFFEKIENEKKVDVTNQKISEVVARLNTISGLTEELKNLNNELEKNGQ